MQKNEVYTHVIDDIGFNGEGITKVDGITCFVPYSITGEKVEFKVLKVSGNLAYCKYQEIVTPADQRVRPKCPVYTKCGGCQLQHLKYTEQLKLKANTIKNCFKKIAGLDVTVSKPIKSESEYGYRNKLQLPVREVNGNVKIGFYAENSHRVVDINKCPIQQPWNEELISIFRNFMHKYSISAYNEEKKEGLIKHIVARSVGGNLMIIVVINGKNLPFYTELVQMLSISIKKFSLFISENTVDNNVVLGDNVKLLFGSPSYSISECGIKYSISPTSFMQVNDTIRTKLYQEVIKSCELDEDTICIDAYSGAGLLTAMIAKRSYKAIGIEIIKEAVENANSLAKLNGLEGKMINYHGLCEELLPTIIEEERKSGKRIVVVLDPPRKGCNIKVINALLKACPDKIVYVSCSPQTLARDVGILVGKLENANGEIKKATSETNGKYAIKRIKPFDLFPQTKHIETVACLARQ